MKTPGTYDVDQNVFKLKRSFNKQNTFISSVKRSSGWQPSNPEVPGPGAYEDRYQSPSLSKVSSTEF